MSDHKFIERVFSKRADELTLQDIDGLILAQREEDQYLEYKGPEIIGSRENLSKTVTGFLNSDGGLLIIGVETNPTKKSDSDLKQRVLPARVTPLRNTNSEQIQQLVINNVLCSVLPSIQVQAIHSDQGEVLLVEIPQGESPPYQAKNGVYYRRINVINVPMQHYELQDLFGKRRRPLLRLLINIERYNDGDLYMRFLIVNAGLGIAKHTHLTANLQNLEIKATPEGHLQRLDNLRKMPSVQYDDHLGVIFPDISRYTSIGAVLARVINRDAPIIIDYSLICEDMSDYQEAIRLDEQNLKSLAEKSKHGQISAIGNTEVLNEFLKQAGFTGNI